ncbi:hypothetical protein BH11GEM2_BH11GEM2_05670 [soil metagenome]
MAVESAAATHRAFVQLSEARCTYAFEAGKRREITAAALEPQIELARYSQPIERLRDPL